jgi:predicted nucleic acid-binding protein
MKKLRIYLDTSVISFLFADDAPEKCEMTRGFFENYVKQDLYDVYVSPIVIDEINRTTDIEKRTRMLTALDDFPVKNLVLAGSAHEIRKMAEMYIQDGIIPMKKIDDALHLAICTVMEMDVLLSWNYKHLANINREMRIMAANLKEGYTHGFRMVTPLEVMYEDD